MRVPLNWLKEYVDIDIPVTELVAKLTAIGHMQDKKPEKMGDDVVLDLEVRQNRPDCLSILGVAREVAAVTNKQVRVPNSKFQIPSTMGDGGLAIENKAQDLCRRFVAVRIRLGARNSELGTPKWMRDRLSSYGIKTISPIVDITNYVMVEYGEPMHAFDARQVKDGHIIIRKAKDGEILTVLGGRGLILTEDDLVIADEDKILSFSGLIGGEGSGVKDDTTDIILEAATYNQAVIRRSSLRHQVRTEASTRHEKFLHPHLAEVALDRAVQLVLDICGGEIVAQADSYPAPEKDKEITLRLSEIERLGGVSMTLDQAQNYLESLGFQILSTQHLSLSTSAPYWRTDIEYEADLVEEVLRLYGYENITPSLPPFPPPKDITSSWFRLEERIRDLMLRFGFDEQITEPLTKKANSERQMANGRMQIVLQNALNADKNALRTSLKDGLLHALKHQKKFGKDRLCIFELGKIYGKTSDPSHPYSEKHTLAYLMHDASSAKKTLYLNAKGVAQQLCTQIGFQYMDNMVHLALVDEHTAFCEMVLEDMRRTGEGSDKHGGEVLSLLPNTQRFDISIAIKQGVHVSDLIQEVKTACPEVQDVVLGEDPRLLEDGQQTILLRFTVSASKKSKEALIKELSSVLTTKYHATIR